jgi:hypothetical protein
MSDAVRCDRSSIFREVMASTKRLKFRDSKAVSLWEANGFAFVPHTCRFLGQQSSGCRTSGEGTGVRILHLRPILPFLKGDARPDLGRLSAPRGLFCGFQHYSAVAVENKEGPNIIPFWIFCRGLGGAHYFLRERRHVR